jgi:hypothetical protein
VRIVARCCADHIVVTRLAAGLAQERRYPAIRRDRSCRDWIGLFLHSQLISAISPGCHGGPAHPTRDKSAAEVVDRPYGADGTISREKAFGVGARVAGVVKRFDAGKAGA